MIKRKHIEQSSVSAELALQPGATVLFPNRGRDDLQSASEQVWCARDDLGATPAARPRWRLAGR